MPIQDKTNYLIILAFIGAVLFLLTTNMGLFTISKKMDARENEHVELQKEITEIRTIVSGNRELITYRNRVIGSNELSKTE